MAAFLSRSPKNFFTTRLLLVVWAFTSAAIFRHFENFSVLNERNEGEKKERECNGKGSRVQKESRQRKRGEANLQGIKRQGTELVFLNVCCFVSSYFGFLALDSFTYICCFVWVKSSFWPWSYHEIEEIQRKPQKRWWKGSPWMNGHQERKVPSHRRLATQLTQGAPNLLLR